MRILIVVLATILCLATELYAQNVTYNFKITWVDNSKDEAGFNIYRDGKRIGQAGKDVTTYSEAVTGPAKQQYCWTVTAYNTFGESAKSPQACMALPDIPPTGNKAPIVNAGPDQTITLPALATLVGTVTDDKLPSPPAAVTTTWTKVSGPGTVAFANANAAQTTATFSVAGTYVLRLTGNDSVLQASDDISIVVNPGTLPPKPAAPGGLTVTIESVTAIRMSWANNSTNETSFEIRRKTGKPPATKDIKGIPAATTLYIDEGLTAATTYCYQVKALNAGGSSAYSNQSCGTTLAK